MKKFLSLAVITTAVLCCAVSNSYADVIASWNFDTLDTGGASGAIYGPIAADVGSGSAVGVHASAATVWSNPAGNGSLRSFSSNNWAVGDYYEFQDSTLGYQTIDISWDQTGSNTGPRDFVVQYSLDGTNFFSSQVPSLINGSWSAGTQNVNTMYSQPFGALVNDAATVFFRLTVETNASINGGTLASGGTGRVDNFTVNGVSAVPEPASMAMLSIASVTAGVGAWRRRKANTAEAQA